MPKTVKRSTERRTLGPVSRPPSATIGARALMNALKDAFVVVPVGLYKEEQERATGTGRAATNDDRPATVNGSRRRRADDEDPDDVITPDRERENFGRAFRRARYFVSRAINPAGLAPTRAKVYKALKSSGDDGLTARQLKSVCRLPHGSVQQTLNWLRTHKLVKAAESNLD